MRISIFLMNRCIGSGIHSIIDALIATNYTLVKADLKPLFEWGYRFHRRQSGYAY